ncbi:hypothetical protein [Mesorhizobium caraganae]|uniref:hypothetical protein n=1 Tax=Mesorhizobium caraganae TaxID=483206 RepID=UPI003335E8FC
MALTIAAQNVIIDKSAGIQIDSDDIDHVAPYNSDLTLQRTPKSSGRVTPVI